MAMSLMATHLNLTREAGIFFIGGKVPQPNQESFISASHQAHCRCFSVTIESAA
jgi:hypothetical protein